MLKHSDIHPTIPATDLSRARTWYADKLGLNPDAEFPGAVSYRVGENSGFLLFSAAAAGTTEHQVATWIVQDVEAEVAELRSRGVVFEEYDRPVADCGRHRDHTGRAGGVVQRQRGQRAHHDAARLGW